MTMRQPAGAMAVRAHLRGLELAGRARGTVAARRRHLARLDAALAGGLLAAAPAGLMAWRESLHMSDGAVIDAVSHVRQFYKWAAREGLIAADPSAGLPAPRKPRRLPRPVSEDGLFGALATAPPRVRPWLVLAGWCGLRACEIAGLRRELVLDTAAPPVLVVAAEATKGHRERVVPLSDFVLSELAGVLPRSGYVFRRRDGAAGPNQPWRVSQLANRHLRESGTGATLHQLRHRFGTQAYRASKDLRAVQELLGHANPSATAGYAAYDQAALRAAVEALPVPGPQPVRKAAL